MEKILEERITVELLGSGHAAVHRVLIDEGDGNPYWDVQQTGIGRYNTREEAIKEAKYWSVAEGIEFKE